MSLSLDHIILNGNSPDIQRLFNTLLFKALVFDSILYVPLASQHFFSYAGPVLCKD